MSTRETNFMPQDEGAIASDSSLAHALAVAKASGRFDERRLKELMADARRVSRLLKQPLEAISLEPIVVRSYLPAIARATGGTNAKRFRNIRSNLKALAQTIGLHEPRELERHQFSAVWKELYKKIPDDFSRMGIVRLMRFCDWCGGTPEAVDDDILDRFTQHLEDHTFTREIPRLVWRTADSWNRLAEDVPNWPEQRLATRRDTSRHIARPLTDYPESLQHEFEGYFTLVAGADPFAPDRPLRPLRPATITTRRRQLRRAADDLVESGRSPETIVSLADLVDPKAFQTILRPRYDLQAQRWPMSARQIAALLLDVARYLNRQPGARVSDEQLNELNRSFDTIKTTFAGMPASTRVLLQLLDDPVALQRVLEIPSRLATVARSLRNQSPVRAAQANECALLVDLVQRVPLRRRNLMSIDIDRHFSRDAKGRLTGLTFEGSEMKNGRSFSSPLPRSLCERIEHHVTVYRPQFPGATESRFLFPSPGGRHRGGEALSRRFTAAVQDHAGIEMRLHDVRHVAAYLMLREDPRSGPLVQQLLNHASLKTTERYYGDLRQGAAVRHYDELLAGQRLTRRKKS